MEMILAQTTAPKVPGWPSDGNFLQGHPKPAFSKKVQRGDQENFFKNCLKSSSGLKGPKALLRKWHYSLICMHLNCKDCKRFRRKKRSKSARMAKLWQFSQGHPKPAFSEKVQRGDEEKFFKDSQKLSPNLKGPTALLRKSHYPLISMQLKTGEHFGASSDSKSARMAKVWQFLEGHPKPAFSVKVQRGDQGKFLKNRPKSSLRLKGLKALCRKCHYPQTSMLLRCKDRRRFYPRTGLQTCPNGEVMAIFARSPKTRIF